MKGIGWFISVVFIVINEGNLDVYDYKEVGVFKDVIDEMVEI